MKLLNHLKRKARTYTVIGGLATASFVSFAFDQYFEISKNLDIFVDVYQQVNKYYVDEVEAGKLMRTAIDGMLESLDPYTNYFSESQSEDLRIEMSGQYSGIGTRIRQRGEYIVVDEPYEGSPAAEADLRVGDILLEADGKSLKSKSTDEVSKFLKGQAATTLKLKIKREGVGEMIKEINRRDIKVNNVPYYGMVNSTTGMIKLVSFTNNASGEVAEALKALREKNPGMKSVILDLRGNGGGLLHESINIVNVFTPKNQLVVSTKGKLKEWDKEYRTLNMPVDEEIPLVVLVDKGSASASEIVSGSIQDLDRGVVIGEKSFGKGLVQSTRPLKFGTQMKITTAKYYTPSGRCIQKLDYSKRDANGKAVVIADSLRKTFNTKSGRKVYDGAGVWPDVAVEHPELSKVSLTLISKLLIFDYATQYRNAHPTIAASREFKITDADFQDFMTFLKDKEYSYNTETEKALEDMKQKAVNEKYFTAIEGEYNELKKKLSHDKNADLLKNKSEIMELLQTEIARRYYFQKAIVETTFDNDPDIREALTVLADADKYRAILKGTGK